MLALDAFERGDFKDRMDSIGSEDVAIAVFPMRHEWSVKLTTPRAVWTTETNPSVGRLRFGFFTVGQVTNRRADYIALLVHRPPATVPTPKFSAGRDCVAEEMLAWGFISDRLVGLAIGDFNLVRVALVKVVL